jgi:hypothetical protein
LIRPEKMGNVIYAYQVAKQQPQPKEHGDHFVRKRLLVYQVYYDDRRNSGCIMLKVKGMDYLYIDIGNADYGTCCDLKKLLNVYFDGSTHVMLKPCELLVDKAELHVEGKENLCDYLQHASPENTIVFERMRVDHPLKFSAGDLPQ